MADSSEKSTGGKNGIVESIYSQAHLTLSKIYEFLHSIDRNFFNVLRSLRSPISFRNTRRRRRIGLPLHLPSNSLAPISVLTETAKTLELLEDIQGLILTSLHVIHNSLCFWRSRAEGTDAQKAHHMVFERGPRAFIESTTEMIQGCITEGSATKRLVFFASTRISEKISVLSSLQHCLARFLAQMHVKIDGVGEDLIKDPDNSLPSLLVGINDLFIELEQSTDLQHELEMRDNVTYMEERPKKLPSLQFAKLPDTLQKKPQWSDGELSDALALIRMNLQRLDSYLSEIVSEYQRPSKATLCWLRYTCGAVGLSICSVWILKHSSLMGSPDIDNWIRDAKASISNFWKDHVETPLLSIRDELFETFKRRNKTVMELAEVRLTEKSLHRMLLAFSEQTKGQKLSDASDQEMLEIVMARYEKELMHPLQNLLGGELARALLIQVQKLKLDIEMAMLELDQILRANEINFAILAALPAFFLTVLLGMLLRGWVVQDKGAEGRGRVARVQRRLLVVEVEKKIMQYQIFIDQEREKDAQWTFGLVLYFLDRLHQAVERHAKTSGEWTLLRDDILDLGKPGLKTDYKLAVTSRLERVYDCLLPAPERLR